MELIFLVKLCSNPVQHPALELILPVAVSTDMADWYTRNADQFYGPEEQKSIMRTNLLRILSNVYQDM
jgi:hypothetical protein